MKGITVRTALTQLKRMLIEFDGMTEEEAEEECTRAYNTHEKLETEKDRFWGGA